MGDESIPREYAQNALKRGKEYFDYQTYKIEYSQINKYKISSFLGRGKYSQVFKGISTEEESKSVVIKVLRPIREKKINREIKILKELKGIKNVIELLDVVRDIKTNTRSIIFPYEEHIETRSLFKTLSPEDIVYYIRELLTTIDHIHSKGIFHRDLKPHNIVINHKRRVLKIIDWGLAEYYLPNIEYATKVASLHFKGPELLLGYKYYNYSLDIWTIGCIVGEMVFTRVPMFNGLTNEDQLEKIVSLCGTNQLKKYIKTYKLNYPQKSLDSIYATYSPEDTWKDISGSEIRIPPCREREGLIDLVKRMLIFDHIERPTAKECLYHLSNSLSRDK